MRLTACPSCHAQYDTSRFAGTGFSCRCGTRVDIQAERLVHVVVKRCSSCGAPVEERAAACTYCEAPIVRDERQLNLLCPECFARNTEGSHFCRGCGVEFKPQRLDLIGRELSCPRCAAEKLVQRAVANHAACECPGCAGLWVQAMDFEAMVQKALDSERRKAGVRLDGSAKRPPVVSQGLGGVTYIKCPECGQVMNRKNFGRVSGVIIDECGEHGVWLDENELERIATFILAGGMEKTRQRKAEDERQEAARLREARLPQPAASSWEVRHDVGLGRVNLGPLGDRIIDLLDELFR